jgi:hypothetical protein
MNTESTHYYRKKWKKIYLFCIQCSLLFHISFQEWYNREERETHLSRDTSSMAEKNKKRIPNKKAQQI